MKEINLTNSDLKIVVDDEDYLYLLNYSNWNLCKDRTGVTGYARCNVNHITRYLHKIVIKRMGLKVPKGVKCDHINQNKLDNRRSNLRVATHSQNGANINRKTNACKYKGVYKNYDKFIAQISINHKPKHLGRFDTAEEAAKAYNKAAVIYYGEFAVLNNV